MEQVGELRRGVKTAVILHSVAPILIPPPASAHRKDSWSRRHLGCWLTERSEYLTFGVSDANGGRSAVDRPAVKYVQTHGEPHHGHHQQARISPRLHVVRANVRPHWRRARRLQYPNSASCIYLFDDRRFPDPLL